MKLSEMEFKQQLSIFMFFTGLAVLTVFSLIPLPELLPLEFSWKDKVVHCLAYFILAWICRMAFRPVNWYHSLLIGLSLAAYGGLIELIQPLTNRTADIWDFTANSTGILLALVIPLLLSKLNRSGKS